MNPKDAANKKYVDNMIAAGPSTSTGGTAEVSADINANKFKIINLKNPTDPQDAVNHRFVERNFIRKEQDIDLKDHKITGLHPLDPNNSEESNAAPKGYVDREIFKQIDLNNQIESVKYFEVDGTTSLEADQDFGGYKTTNLGYPVDPNKATTNDFVQGEIRGSAFRVTLEGAQEKLKMKNHGISGFANPIKLNDAVHKHYLDSQIQYLQQQTTTFTERTRNHLELLETPVVRHECLALREAEAAPALPKDPLLNE